MIPRVGSLEAKKADPGMSQYKPTTWRFAQALIWINVQTLIWINLLSQGREE